MKTKLKLGGTFTFEHIRDGKVIDVWEEDNLVVDEGLEYSLGVAFDGSTAPVTAWYVGLFTGNYTPTASDTAATFPAAANETTAQYSEGLRPAWVEAGVSSKTIGNTASTAVFTFVPASTFVYGSFLASDASKGGTSGILAAASRFSTVRTMLASDILNVSYSLSVAAA